MTFPENLFDLIFMPRLKDVLESLSTLAETEPWEYQHSTSEHPRPILYNYLRYTYKRLVDENKIVVSDDGQSIAFNTGLVTAAQEPIYCFGVPNRLPNHTSPWHFNDWKRNGAYEMGRFSALPQMAHYFDDPSRLVFDCRKDLRVNVEHVVTDNKDRFPAPYNTMDVYALQTFLKGAVDNVIERVRRNYKTAIPQYYRGGIQLLLPLCIGSPHQADLALVVTDEGAFYRASTCLTLDMAYNNARQLARPDRDWLNP